MRAFVRLGGWLARLLGQNGIRLGRERGAGRRAGAALLPLEGALQCAWGSSSALVYSKVGLRLKTDLLA